VKSLDMKQARGRVAVAGAHEGDHGPSCGKAAKLIAVIGLLCRLHKLKQKSGKTNREMPVRHSLMYKARGQCLEAEVTKPFKEIAPPHPLGDSDPHNSARCCIFCVPSFKPLTPLDLVPTKFVVLGQNGMPTFKKAFLGQNCKF
jgi:hypothetical protein